MLAPHVTLVDLDLRRQVLDGRRTLVIPLRIVQLILWGGWSGHGCGQLAVSTCHLLDGRLRTMDVDHVKLYITQYDDSNLTKEEYNRAVSTLDDASRERAGRLKRSAEAWS